MMIITFIKIIKEKFSIITIIFLLTRISMMVSKKKRWRKIITRQMVMLVLAGKIMIFK